MAQLVVCVQGHPEYSCADPYPHCILIPYSLFLHTPIVPTKIQISSYKISWTLEIFYIVSVYTRHNNFQYLR